MAKMMMNPPGPDEGNNFLVGFDLTNRIGERRSMGGRIALGGIPNRPPSVAKVGVPRTAIGRVGAP